MHLGGPAREHTLSCGCVVKERCQKGEGCWDYSDGRSQEQRTHADFIKDAARGSAGLHFALFSHKFVLVESLKQTKAKPSFIQQALKL